ncbi:MAG: hypothetical protein J6A73_08390 [Lachnospiraceae bacterium]|nr:hypothetical protein [Lachnospiraceae bacterium]
MKHAVRIKNTSGGMTVYLNNELEFEVLLSEIAKKFGEAAKFFGNAKTVLSLEGRELTDEEEARIVEVITESTQLEILYLIGKEQEPEPEVIEEVPEEIPVQEETPKEERVVFYKRCIEPGEVIKADRDVVIFGNVSPCATIISTNSIYVLGGLYGEAYAGVDNGKDYVVAAMDFTPQKIGIGSYEYIGKKASKWKKKNSYEPQIAYVKDKKIITEQITKELLNSLV